MTFELFLIYLGKVSKLMKMANVLLKIIDSFERQRSLRYSSCGSQITLEKEIHFIAAIK